MKWIGLRCYGLSAWQRDFIHAWEAIYYVMFAWHHGWWVPGMGCGMHESEQFRGFTCSLFSGLECFLLVFYFCMSLTLFWLLVMWFGGCSNHFRIGC